MENMLIFGTSIMTYEIILKPAFRQSMLINMLTCTLHHGSQASSHVQNYF